LGEHPANVDFLREKGSVMHSYGAWPRKGERRGREGGGGGGLGKEKNAVLLTAPKASKTAQTRGQGIVFKLESAYDAPVVLVTDVPVSFIMMHCLRPTNSKKKFAST
jgi:hypothetical protein